jgi:hypothetical protein
VNSQEIIKLTAALAALLCIVAGIVALFRGLKAEGVIDFSALAKGKLKTGSAGIVLLFFGTFIFATLILKGYSEERTFNGMRNTSVWVSDPFDPLTITNSN